MGNNCIVTIKRNDIEASAGISWRELHEATFSFAAPFTFYLDNGQRIEAREVVRIMPGKRMVVFGEWQGKSIVAKLFFDPQDARRHAERDLVGIKVLQDNRIPTPALYQQGQSLDKRVQILIFEFIDPADNLHDLCRHRIDDDSVLNLFQAVMVELATQHVFGILQHDVHLQNFLVTDKVIYSLDGGQIETLSYLLPKKKSMDNLALFLSQLGVGAEKLQEKLFRHYAKVRGWLMKKDDLVDLFLQIKQWRLHRWDRFEKKIFRDSTQFKLIKGWRQAGMADRTLASPELISALRQPDELFIQPLANVLKNGRSSTVVKASVAGRELVVKRYNMKSLLHWLRRCLRPTRAARSWRLAHKLNLFGVATAAPVAFVEARFFGLRGKSYYISEYISSENLLQYFSRHANDQAAVEMMVRRVVRLLRGLRKLDMSHGDLKAANIMINAAGQPVLIDLDGAVEHTSASGLRKAWLAEIKRFLRNFDEMPSLRARFEAELKS